MNYIRKYLADVVVYQSVFVERSWNKKFGKTKKISSVITKNEDGLHQFAG